MAARPWNAAVLDQVKYIEGAFAPDGQPSLYVQKDNDGGVLYMFAEGEILVREEHSADVVNDIGPGEIDWIVRGVVRHKLAGTRCPTVHEALGKVAEKRGGGVATPNHLLTVAGVAGPCPATEPEEVPAGIEPYPAIQEGGDGVQIYIADTGLIEDTVQRTCPWLKGVERAPKGAEKQGWDEVPSAAPAPQPPAAGQPAVPAAPTLATQANDREIKPYAGHGTFVAGVARCMAPHADVMVSNVFNTAGSALESDFVKELDQALDFGVDIFNLSITAPTLNDRPLLAFAQWLERATEHKGVVCVAAAGNSGMREPSWPAACPAVVSVGALAADWRSRADFSNYGGWVDIYAPGRDIVNAFAIGTYKCYVDPYADDPRKFYGMARWSGTSFSAPMVSGLIAARMSRTGENGREAAAALLAQARSQAIPGTGPILLPYDNRYGR